LRLFRAVFVVLLLFAIPTFPTIVPISTFHSIVVVVVCCCCFGHWIHVYVVRYSFIRCLRCVCWVIQLLFRCSLLLFPCSLCCCSRCSFGAFVVYVSCSLVALFVPFNSLHVALFFGSFCSFVVLVGVSVVLAFRLRRFAGRLFRFVRFRTLHVWLQFVVFCCSLFRYRRRSVVLFVPLFTDVNLPLVFVTFTSVPTLPLCC